MRSKGSTWGVAAIIDVPHFAATIAIAIASSRVLLHHLIQGGYEHGYLLSSVYSSPFPRVYWDSEFFSSFVAIVVVIVAAVTGSVLYVINYYS